ncbi:hypothetical protein D5018_13545 [Parashewanella curva]|uniref:Glycine cleavage system transcriptional repressor n=1 Tax=Parashewanella curva TaxID=2338552 RepID=A0A3L8PV06_9GAMM|nr:hypothetical protein [Parashewanella curva]RLV59160.1 hypothetical protein D5018_13545 [Parashewanella curva]
MMKVSVISTVSGLGGSNVVTELAQETRELGGHWQTSKVITLADQFTALFLVMIEEHKLADFKQAMSRRFSELSFEYSIPKMEATNFSEPISVTVHCVDRAGLTKDIHELMQGLELDVEQFSFFRAPVTMLGDSVYQANIQLRLPSELNIEKLTEKFEELDPGLRLSTLG